MAALVIPYEVDVPTTAHLLMASVSVPSAWKERLARVVGDVGLVGVVGGGVGVVGVVGVVGGGS
jgi:hypothetical protein